MAFFLCCFVLTVWVITRLTPDVEVMRSKAPTFNFIVLLVATCVLFELFKQRVSEAGYHAVVLPEVLSTSLQLLITCLCKSALLIAVMLTGALMAWHIAASLLRQQGGDPRPIRCAHAKDILGILTGLSVPSHGLKNKIEPYKSRAMPNQRLVDAFGINNCFSTTDKEYCERFHDRAEELIVKDDADWKDIAQMATTLAHAELETTAK